MAMLQLALILVVFVIGVILMMTKKMPAILTLPLMGIIIAAIAGVPFISADPETQSITTFVIGSGATRLASTITVTAFGAIFAEVIQRQGISGAIIRKAAELAGDKPLVIALVMTAATALIFTAMSGAGPVIMVAQIAIPLMISAGVAPVVAASLVLLGLSLGGIFNVANYQMYVDTIGMSMDMVISSSIVIGIICAVITLAYAVINVRGRSSAAWAMPAEADDAKKSVNPVALVMPLVPIVLVFLLKWNAETALILSIVVTALITTPREAIQVISAATVDGIKNVSGAIGLMIGIGILLNGVSSTAAVSIMSPVIAAILPSSPVAYVILFTILSPLTLYRGPLNMYGLGSGFANVLISAGTLSPAAVGMALRATGTIQGVSDPTNTQNVIVADYANVDVNDILKSTIPYTMLMAFASLVYCAIVMF